MVTRGSCCARFLVVYASGPVAAPATPAGERTIVVIVALPRPRARSWCAAVALVALWSTGLVAPAGAASGASKAPAEWDEQVAPIAREVERIRGLRFERPVAIRYLDDAAFGRRVAIDEGRLTVDDRDDAERAEAQLRAIGLVGPDVDLVGAISDLQEAGVLAYYDPDRKRVTMRGAELDAARKVTLAHELVHALQDQHFNLSKLQRDAKRAHASFVLDLLVEGDASNVEHEYLDTLSDRERDDYSLDRRAAFDEYERELEEADVPAAVSAVFTIPYVLGPMMVQFAVAVQGDGAVDALFANPPRSELAFLDPSVGSLREVPLRTPPPALEADEQRSGRRDVFGAFALYLMLSTTMDAVDALDIARGWGGDSMITLTRGDQTCIRATFTGRDADASAAIADGLRRWATNGARPAATVTTAGQLATLTACDGDAAPIDPSDALTRAEVTLVLRSQLFLQLLQTGVGDEVARCTADGAVHAPSFAPVRDATAASSGADVPAAILEPLQRAARRIVAECREG